MEKMLVTQALNELKTLDSRIKRAIASANFVTAAKSCEKNVTSNMTKEDFNDRAKASLQSVNDLIERRKKIKSATVASNAITIVNVAGVDMTRAEAIERKSSIEYEKSLLDQMKTQYANATRLVNVKNTEMEAAIERLVHTAFGKDNNATIKPEAYSSIAEPYKKSNEFSLVDPINIVDEINKRTEELDEFLKNVDSALQISNCTTYIEF